MALDAFAIQNEYRVAAGLPELVWNESFYEACKIRSQELVASFGHTRPDGRSYDTALGEVGITYNRIYRGENAIWGYNTARAAMDGWYGSTGHRQNMLNSNYDYGAVAFYYENGVYYGIALFGGDL